ncbi:MAG TPA: metallophosphoesterase [Thermoanaerobaculia bacterium]|jgi:predicted MPP superfamily phosphohydrolase
MRVLIFLAVILFVFVPFNLITCRQLLRLHPDRRRWILGTAIAGNLMWLFFPFLRSSTPVMRALRATLGPVWFGWTSFAILYSILMLLVLLAWLPVMRRYTFVQVGRWPSRLFITTMIAGFLVGCWQALVPLRVEQVRVPVAGLPAALEGRRLVLMGDLHVGLFTRPSRLDRIFSTASALRPDAVLIAGDLIDDDPHFVPKLLAGTRTLSPDIPLFAVLGNHEVYGDPTSVIHQLRGSRIRLLVNEGVNLDGLWIAGMGDVAAQQLREPLRRDLMPNLDKALASRPPSAPVVVLSHQPRIFPESQKRRLPLTVSAHTHGGQCGFRPWRWSLAGVFLKYHMGLYQEGLSALYINTGTGYWLFPFRLGMTPEITLIELRST